MTTTDLKTMQSCCDAGCSCDAQRHAAASDLDAQRHCAASDLDAAQWEAYRDVYAFAGNELLVPMNRSGERRGLDPLFWDGAPLPQNEHGRNGLRRLTAYAQAAEHAGEDDPHVPGALQTSVEFAHLFIGPPKPAAEPWETMNDPVNTRHVGYGRATVAMKDLLAEEGLELSNDNHQYEDHIGIELLYLSMLCEKAAAQAGTHNSTAIDAMPTYEQKVRTFLSEHPLRWIQQLRDSVDATRPNGYYSALLEYVHGVLEDQAASLG